MKTVAALYVQTNGCYFGLPGVDPWDEARDARLYDGPHPVVAHPPCSTWGRLAPINQARYGHPVGSDGGCFAAALASVRRWGGVPAETYAWATFGLPRPRRGTWTNTLLKPREWVTEVSQVAYGHRARKRTWLLYVGNGHPPALDWSEPAPSATVSFLTNHGGGSLPRLLKREAKATPPEFRDLLIAIARSAQFGPERAREAA